MKLSKVAGAVVLACGLPLAAVAQVTIDPNGAAAGGPIVVGALDWTQTSFLAQGGQAAIANFAAGNCVATPALCNFTVLTMASLGNFIAPDGTTQIAGTGLGTNFQWTMVASFTERVTGVVGNIATFSTVPAAGANVEIFYDTNLNANALTGFGFNDGRLILKATTIQNASGLFTVTDPTPVALDGFGGNDYTGQQTVTGTGSNTAISVGGITRDATFFLQALQAFGLAFANISIGLPYNTTDPADCYQTGSTGTAVGGTNPTATAACNNAHTNGLMSAQTSVNGGYVPNIGVVNGLFGGLASSPDFVAQTDFNSPVSAVPEPGSLALLGLTLVGLGWTARRRSRR